MSEKPILVKAGDTRVLLNGVSPKVDCRVLSEDYYQSLERQLEEARELIKAVAHIGIDWGYGKFELTQDHIDKARKLYEAHDQLKEKG